MLQSFESITMNKRTTKYHFWSFYN